MSSGPGGRVIRSSAAFGTSWFPHVPSVLPHIVIAPVVGFDGANYRLGYGGGFFDRTLAAMQRRPLVIGVGYAGSRLRTIHPQPHDIPMDVIVTDA